MSLVPILYTALLIFAVFSIVVISISYVSYKVKHRGRQERHNAEDSGASYYYQPKLPEKINSTPAESRANSIKVVTTIKRPDLRRTVELPYYRSRSNYNSETGYQGDINRKQSSKFTVYDKTEINEDRYYDKTNHNNSRTRTGLRARQNRIEILNNTKPPEDEQPKERYHSTGSGSIALPKYYAGFQAISYYSEKEDEMFFKPSRNYE